MKKTLLALLAGSISVAIAVPAFAQDFYDQGSSEPWRNCYHGARTPSEARDFDKVAIIAKNGKAPTLQQVEKAIIAAGKEKEWVMNTISQGTASGKIEATLLVRGKHTVIVDIVYSPENYSIHYKDTINMNAAFCNGKTWLHPNYNVWVSRLNDEIQSKLDAI